MHLVSNLFQPLCLCAMKFHYFCHSPLLFIWGVTTCSQKNGGSLFLFFFFLFCMAQGGGNISRIMSICAGLLVALRFWALLWVAQVVYWLFSIANWRPGFLQILEDEYVSMFELHQHIRCLHAVIAFSFQVKDIFISCLRYDQNCQDCFQFKRNL